jgi:mannose-6-phosphate isomerase
MMDFAADDRRVAASFVTYVFRDMAALWATHGWDDERRRGRERLASDLTDSNLGYRRSMVVGRQLFFFSHAFRITGETLFRERVDDLFSDLERNFRDPLHGGWYFSLADDGRPANTSKDLYAHAFILFGLVHYYAVFRNQDVAALVRNTSSLITGKFGLPAGWLAPSTTRTWEVAGRSLQQNPHMHLLEAFLSAYGAIGDQSFLRDAEILIAIFAERLLTADGKMVLEHFDDEGRPARKNGRLIEPGHLYEWYWLLNEYAEMASLPAIAHLSIPVFEWVEQRCRDGAGGIWDMVDVDGQTVSERKRIWPVTEAIKAWTTRVRILKDAESRARLLGWIRFIMDRYFIGQGGWHEYLSRSLAPDSDFMPASTPYHVAMAALEVDRLLGGVGAFGLRDATAHSILSR